MNKKSALVLLSASITLGASTVSHANEIKTQRIYGDNRYETGVEISKKNFEKSEKVVIVSGENFADALTAGNVASTEDIPLLLTKKNEIPSSVMEEIERLGVKEVLIIGGESSISKNIESQFVKISKINRISGDNRESTSLEVAKYLSLKYDIKTIGISNSHTFSDALASTPYLNIKDGVLLLSNKNKLDENAKTFISNKEVIVFGGENSISNNLLIDAKGKRISGRNRFETSENIAKKYLEKTGEFKDLIITSGNDYPDALSSVILSKKYKSPILFSNISTLENIKTYKNLEKIFLIGGTKSIDEAFEKKLEKQINDSKIKDNETRRSRDRSNSGSSSGTKIEKYINIPDKLFLKLVNKNIDPNRADDAKVTEKDMLKLKQLSVYDSTGMDIKNILQGSKRKPILEMEKLDTKWMVSRGLKSIEGIQYAKNLEAIEISECEISDITSLKDLKKLTYVEIDRNRITDVSPLKDLINLEHLKLYNNLITDISPLKNLTKLNYLDVHFNVGDDGKNGITNVDVLENMKELELIDLSANHITNVDVLTKLPKLRIIDYSGNNVNDYTKLGEKQKALTEKLMEGNSDYSCGFFGQNIDVNENFEVSSKGGKIVVDSPFKGLDEMATSMFEAETFFVESSAIKEKAKKEKVDAEKDDKDMEDLVEEVSYDPETKKFTVTIKENKTNSEKDFNIKIDTGADDYKWFISGINIKQKSNEENKKLNLDELQ